MANHRTARLAKLSAAMIAPAPYSLEWAPSYIPRDVFSDFHARKQRWAVVVAHRRAGKTPRSLDRGRGRQGALPRYLGNALQRESLNARRSRERRGRGNPRPLFLSRGAIMI
jgi:hypothetical protein